MISVLFFYLRRFFPPPFQSEYIIFVIRISLLSVVPCPVFFLRRQNCVVIVFFFVHICPHPKSMCVFFFFFVPGKIRLDNIDLQRIHSNDVTLIRVKKWWDLGIRYG